MQEHGLWDQWETILDTYRDVNKLFGDIIKVTPSSKCVGDLALYLVNCKPTTADLLDTINPPQIDFESVVGLLRRPGFPTPRISGECREDGLKGAERRKGGWTGTPPANFSENQGNHAEWGVEISPEMAMSSLMYPKVFSDFAAPQEQGFIVAICYSVYFYAMKTTRLSL